MAAPSPSRTWAPLGIAFLISAIAVAGMPPLAGFLGKALLLDAAGATPFGTWVFAGVLLSSFGVLIALSRAGTAIFWRRGGDVEAVEPDDAPTWLWTAAAPASRDARQQGSTPGSRQLRRCSTVGPSRRRASR